MEHEADVGLVDAHAERGGGDDHIEPVLHERLLRCGALGWAQPGVIRDRVDARIAQLRRDLLRALARRDVHDARLLDLAQALEQGLRLVALPAEGLDAEPDVLPVEPAHQEERVAHAEPRHDLLAHGRRGGGGQGEDRRPPEDVRDGAEAQVVGPEVVPPLADAVRLVHDHERRLGRRQLAHHVVIGELLRREEEELQLVAAELRQRLGSLGLGHGRVDAGRAARFLAL